MKLPNGRSRSQSCMNDDHRNDPIIHALGYLLSISRLDSELAHADVHIRSENPHATDPDLSSSRAQLLYLHSVSLHDTKSSVTA